MPKDEDEGVAALRSRMPWLGREDALELLKAHGGDVEGILRLLETTGDIGGGAQRQPQRNLKGRNPEDAKKKGERYFVGGGPSSGQVVLGGGSDGVDDLINSLFEKARQQSDDDDVDGASAFFGPGRRLGHTAAESPFIESSLRRRRDVSITVYRDGYSIDNGPRMDKESAEGVAFFKALEMGRVPDAISKMYPNTEITARLVDCTQHDAPSTFLPFVGQGRRLAGTTSGPAAPTASSAGPRGDRGTFKLHDGEETAKLAIVNLFGERREFTVNPTRHTVGDLFTLASQHASPGAVAFQLIARDVPPRPLTDRSLTLDEARLRNATVMMRGL